MWETMWAENEGLTAQVCASCQRPTERPLYDSAGHQLCFVCFLEEPRRYHSQ